MTPSAATPPRTIWHVTVDGEPACSSPLLLADERLELPVCGSRHRPRAEEYAAFLRSRHPTALIRVVAEGCPARGE
jgi:hypothetical protein